MKNWIEAFRLRTLPLALSSVFMAGFLAHWYGMFSWVIFGLTVSTTIFLQVLSNLANDYGDSIHGADSNDRKGPLRAVQTGVISKKQMKRAMYILASLSLASGVSLLFAAFANQWLWIVIFLVLGLLSIYAAITYTAGKKPYGYKGLGDLSVLVFFGLAGVLGSFYLQTKTFEWQLLLPAFSCGLLATGVLNVNNIRDIESDRKAGKFSIPVRIGRESAVKYHFALIELAMISGLVFCFLNYEGWTSLLFVLSFPLFIKNAMAVKSKVDPAELDPFLKQLALCALLFVVLFGIGLVL